MTSNLTPVVLAAGKGTRMHSAVPKVLHPLAGKPILGHVLDALAEAGTAAPVVVVAPDVPAVETFARAHPSAPTLRHQAPPLGTGDAVTRARDALPATGTVVVLFGDTPFVSAATVVELAATRDEADAAVAVLGMKLADPGGYGRVVTDGVEVLRVVEAAQLDEATADVTLANSGVMAFDAARLPALLDRLPPRPARDGNHEFYLTDTVELARTAGWRCVWHGCDPVEGLGINDRAQLAEAEALLQQRLRRRAMLAGVTLVDPASCYLSADTRFGQDVVIEPHVVIGPGVTFEDAVRVRAFSHFAVDAPKETRPIVVRRGAVVGPFARVRSGSDIGNGAHVGNFVELKNADVGNGAKINHLTYFGDAGLGPRSNVGAGTITCNYDGIAKHRTEIGADVFIGS
ncbi:MAG: bifunctional UDP-N-acetylglucosamine diphosphorylase/glucosamine-1-phosphate N-acetyltransferase GlmU, partial [Pseudomonadota bacterium]